MLGLHLNCVLVGYHLFKFNNSKLSENEATMLLTSLSWQKIKDKMLYQLTNQCKARKQSANKHNMSKS